MKGRFLIVILLICVCTAANAVPAYGGFTKMIQPDGTSVMLQLRGDEFCSWYATAEGVVMARDANGKWGPAPAEMSVAQRRMKAQRAEWKPLLPWARNVKNDGSVTRALGFDIDNFRGLIILVEFNDQEFSRADYAGLMNDMVNQKGYTGYYTTDEEPQKVELTGSVRDYFDNSSAGRFCPEFDVIGPVKVDYSKTYPRGANYIQNMLRPIVIAAKDAYPKLNFSNYDLDGDDEVDMLFFVFAGFGSNFSGNNADLVWPHAWQFNANVEIDGVRMGKYACSTELYGKENSENPSLYGIGCICHEFSHVLGLSDEYDTDYDVNGQVAHPNKWSVMAEGCYLNKTKTPCSYSLFQRYQAGFATPEVISSTGQYTLEDLDVSNHGYRLNSGEADVFFLLENRRKTDSKWNCYLPGEGMLVYRVDSTDVRVWENNTYNNDAEHPYYQLLRAMPAEPLVSGTKVNDSAGDPFPGTGNITSLTNMTTPSLQTWAGVDCELILDNICYTDGVISFEVKNAGGNGIHHATVLPQTEAAAYDLLGRRLNMPAAINSNKIIIQGGRKILK